MALTMGWSGYGFSFTQYHRNDRPTKWIQILNYLCLHKEGATKAKIFNNIDAKGYNNPNIVKRGWNSYVFSALRKKGFIKYDARTHKWTITKEGKAHFSLFSFQVP